MRSPRSQRAALGSLDKLESLEPRLLMASDLALVAPLSSTDQPGVGHPTQLSNADPDQTLRDLHRATGVEIAQNQYGLTGAGQTVVVIDSGIAYDHEALGGGLGAEFRVVGGKDFTEESDTDPYDDGPAGFHGTHVAGIIGSSDSVHTGVAPEVDLVALRVFNDQGRGKLSWLESSLDWVIENVDRFEHPISTVNLSIGTDWNALDLPEYAKLEDEFQDLKQLGVFVSVAAGNRFSAETAGLSYPAVSPYVVPAASSDAAGELSEFSQRHQRTLIAPGEDVTSTVPDYLYDFNGRTDDFYAASGTSMAAPYLAGASVLVRQAMQQAGFENIQVDDIREVLYDTGTPVYDPTTLTTYREINVAAAVESILGSGQLQEDGSFLVDGTDAADEIRLDSVGNVFVNGEPVSIPASAQTIRIAGKAGNDKLVVENKSNSTSVELHPGSLHLGDGTQTYVASDFERIEVHLTGASASASFHGGDGLDELTVKHTHAWMESGETLNYVRGATTVNGWANGDLDKVTLYDSPANDTLVSDVSSTSISNDSFSATVNGYSQVVAKATLGGQDQARIVGTTEDDVVRSHPQYTSLKSHTHFVYAQAFERTTLLGGGGFDSAKVYDSVGDDVFTLGVSSQNILRQGVSTDLVGFEKVEAFASSGQDLATLVGSNSTDHFFAKSTHSWMEHSDALNYVRGFDSVSIDGGGGENDSARLYDSLGDDLFELGPQRGSLKGLGFQYSVHAVPYIHAYSRYGDDTAELEDSENADKLFATKQGSWLRGKDFATVAQSFHRITADSADGQDRLILSPTLAAISRLEDESWLIDEDDIEVLVRGFRR